MFDLVCWGPVTPYRIDILSRLQETGLVIRACLGKTHLYRDDALRHARALLLLPLTKGGRLLPMEVMSSFYHGCPGVGLGSTPVDEHEKYVSHLSPESDWVSVITRLIRSDKLNELYREKSDDFRARPLSRILESLLDELPQVQERVVLPSFEEFMAMEEGA